MPAHAFELDAGRDELIELSMDSAIWERVFTVAPLVLVATKEGDGHNVAPKHLAMPIGWANFFGFVCSPSHATYRNLQRHPEFTVSFPGLDRLVPASMAAGARLDDRSKPTLAAVPVFPARRVEGVLVEGCSLYLECELDRMVDGFGENSLLVGRVVAAAAARAALRGHDVDDSDLLHRLRPLVYLYPGRVAEVCETHAFPFPVDYRR
ncbi:MAG TPA: flavin reductase [Gaiellaceae bacterium]|nr:flavin reductase [Gaiellaceae bacterium]